MEQIGIGVIGCGAMGMSMIRNVLSYDSRLRIVALHDPDAKSIDRALSELKPSPTVCPDYREILKMPTVQWVMIASWNCYHCEQTVAAFEAGKHVFCQKPLALNLDDCEHMKRAWKKSGKLFNIGFTLRYAPHYRKIKQLIADGHIGKIISMEFNETLDFNHGAYIMSDWRRLQKYAGTHLLEKCCHDIDLAYWMVESKAKRVASFGGLNFFIPENAFHVQRLGSQEDGKAAYFTWDGLVNLDPFRSDKDIVDNQVVILEYENGVRATFHTNCHAGIPERRMYILGTEGAIRADVLTGKIHLKRIGFDTRVKDESTEVSGGHGGGDEVMAKELVDSMLHGKAPSADLTDGLISAVTCFAIDEAMVTGTVVDVRPYWDKMKMTKLTGV